MDTTTEEGGDSKEPHVRGFGRFNDFSPAEAVLAVVVRDCASVFQSRNNIRPFSLRQETRRFGGARDKEKRDHTKDKGK